MLNRLPSKSSFKEHLHILLFQEDLVKDEDRNEENLADEDTASDSTLSAVWPIWPVGLNNMRKTPLNYPKIPLPTYTVQDFARRNRLQDQDATENAKRVAEKYSLQKRNTARKTNYENRVEITSKYIPVLTAYNSDTLELGKSKYVKFTNPEHKNLNEMSRLRVGLVPVKHLAGVDYVRLPMIPQEKTAAQYQKTLGANKYCATGMLGVRFKTDAHKR